MVKVGRPNLWICEKPCASPAKQAPAQVRRKVMAGPKWLASIDVDKRLLVIVFWPDRLEVALGRSTGVRQSAI